MPQFLLSLICGIFVPLSPLLAEYLAFDKIADISWYAVGVTYVAAIGLVSRLPSVLILLLITAGSVAFLYGMALEHQADWMKWVQHPAGSEPPAPSPLAAVIVVIVASFFYMVERFNLHVTNGTPFLELGRDVPANPPSGGHGGGGDTAV